MKGWKEYRLDELGVILDSRRIPIKSTDRAKIQGDFPYYGASGIIDHINNYIFDGDYVLIAEDGENLLSRKTPIAFKASGKFWVNNHAHIFKGNNDIVDKLVIFHLINADINQYITGAAQPKLSQSALLSIPFYLPESEAEQRAISAVLSSLDDKIALLHRQNATLEAMAEALFRQLFVVEENDEWKEGKLSDIIEVKSGFAFKSSTLCDEGIYTLVTIKSVQDGYLSLNNADSLSEVPTNVKNYCFLKSGDILLSLTGNVGRCCFVDRDKLLLNQRVSILSARDDKNWAFTYTLFRMQSMKSTLEDMAKGTAQPNLSPVELANMAFSIPSNEILNKFSVAATPLLQKFLANRHEIRTLEKLRDTLLPKLMSGEVRVDVA